MISVIHMEHAKLSAISNLWHARYPAQWRRMLAVANLLDVPLLALIYQRMRELQDGAAREAFTRQEDFSVVTWEWRQAIVSERPRNNSHNLHSNNPNDCASLSESNREIGGSVRTWRL